MVGDLSSHLSKLTEAAPSGPTPSLINCKLYLCQHHLVMSFEPGERGEESGGGGGEDGVAQGGSCYPSPFNVNVNV